MPRGARSRRRTVLVAALACLGGAAAVLALLQLRPPGGDPPGERAGTGSGLVLAGADVDRETDVVADWTLDGASQPPIPGWRSAVATVEVRNDGARPLRLTGAGFLFGTATELGCPYGAGTSRILPRYDVRVPSGRTLPFTLTRPLDLTLPAGGARDLAFTVGPEASPDGSLPVVFSFTVTLSAADGSRVTTPTLTLLNPADTRPVLYAAESSVRDGTGPTTPTCLREQSARAQALLAAGGEISPGLKRYAAGLARLTGPEPTSKPTPTPTLEPERS
ncbi:hypothetical protein [Streptomyces sp. NPDC097619]|uniref:hypothetical protein n=1 Tax=Streptomyces sp. NPDC097619 TaxID=3157228 RepID=UPI0033246FA6